jgi:hypothetical protein
MGDLIQRDRARAFDADAAKVLGEAYDRAIASLSGTLQIENPEEFIARWIIWLGQQGERDVERLRKAVLRQLDRETREADLKLHREFLRKVFASPNGISLRISASLKQISESLELLDRINKQLGQTAASNNEMSNFALSGHPN